MHETIKKMVQAFEKQREKRRRACAVFTALAILVSLTTTYMLVMPANTQEIEYACGLEAHEHSKEDGCYVLVCGYDEDEHTGTSGGAGFDQLFGQEEPVEEIDPAEEETETLPEQEDVLDENREEVSEEEATPSEDAANDETVVNEPAAEEPVQQESVTESVVESEPVQQDAPATVSEPTETASDDAVTETAASQTLVATMTHYDNGPEAPESEAESAETPAAPSEPAADPAPSEESAESSSEATDTPSEPAEDVVEEEIVQEDAPEVEETETEVDEDEVTRDEAVEDEIVEDEIVEDEVAEDAQESSAGSSNGKHVHTSVCYELVCELPEHEHDEECIKEEELELICVIPEHIHAVECYAKAELICVEEAEDHEHGEDCYAEAALICTLEEHIHGDECYAVKQGSLLIVLPEGAEIPEGYDVEYTYIDPDNRYGVAVYARPGTFPDGAQLVAELMEEGSDAYEETSAVLEELVDRGEASYDEFVALDVHFLFDGEEIQPASSVYVCMNVVRLFSDNIDPNSISVRHFAENHEEADEVTTEEEVEVPVEENVIEESTVPLAEEVDEIASAPVVVGDLLVETVADSSEATGQVEGITDQENVVETVAAAFDVSGFSTMLFTARMDIMFTVQHYINIQRVNLKTTSSTVAGQANLPVIDTRGNQEPTDNTYGVLPSGVNPDVGYVPIYTTGENAGKIKTEAVLEKIYKDETYAYSRKMFSNGTPQDLQDQNIKAIDKLVTNGNYALKTVWVRQNSNAALDSVAAEPDWKPYDPKTVTFSNSREAGADVVITNNMVIRLEYNTESTEHTNDVTFYDYNISDGNNGAPGTQSDPKIMYTNQKGINSSGNYSGSGAKLAFGNANTGSGLFTEAFKINDVNQYLNRYNEHYDKTDKPDIGYRGCTFGIVTGLNSSGQIVYRSDVQAPNLFNDGTAIGKTSHAGNLNFKSDGDSFELVSVGGTNISNPTNQLNVLNNPKYPAYGSDPEKVHTTIWTNNFWPMDDLTDTVDFQFGDYTKYKTSAFKYSGSKSGRLDPADDGENHNSYFGFNYAVNFELTPDYIGPLDYLFFGDDDMWVFLSEYDANGNLQSGRLICDIGGVHSSVGEYVDLWDYIPMKRTADQTYRLSFFYTERGASGSTCYMRFTLPSVSSVSPNKVNGVLEISKEVVGATTADKFVFDLDLSSTAACTAYYSNGTMQQVRGTDNEIILGHGEKVTIYDLDLGTTYSVTETSVKDRGSLDGYHTSVRVNSGAITQSNTTSGKISENATKVHFINTTGPVLPSTGGIGTNIYTTVGIVMMLGAGVLLLNQWRRKEVAFCHKK